MYSVLRERVEIESLSLTNPSGGRGELVKIRNRLTSALFRLKAGSDGGEATPPRSEMLTTLSANGPVSKKNCKCWNADEEGLKIMAELLSFLPKNLNKQLRPAIDEVHELVEQLQTALFPRKPSAKSRSSLLSFAILTEYNRLTTRKQIDFTDQQYLVRSSSATIRRSPTNTGGALPTMVDEFKTPTACSGRSFNFAAVTKRRKAVCFWWAI